MTTITNMTLTGSLSLSQTAGIIGTTTNNNADAGSIGELISSIILIGSKVSLVTATAKNITSITLTSGDWDVWGSIWTAPDGGTITTKIEGSINSTTDTLATTPAVGTSYSSQTGFISAAAEAIVLGIPETRVLVPTSSTTTIYLVASVTFSVSTLSGYGNIYARRRR